MSYPQPSADSYAVNGSQFFRLLTPLTSPGDIYESQQSALGFALGPLSDVANVVIAYFDRQVRSFINLAAIGPRRSFVGRLDANNSDKYAPSARPGRLFMFPADLFDPSFQPAGFLPDEQTITFVPPMLDVIQYFSPQQSLVPKRNDKEYRFEGIPNNGASGWIILPFWGRKSATIRFTNQNATGLQTALRGVNYFINDGTAGVERQLLSSAAQAPGTGRDVILTSNANVTAANPITITNVGPFDALAVFLQLDDPSSTVPIQVTVSDDP
jgi:hypothetical protein